MIDKLWVIVTKDGEDFLIGGGSSSPSFIRAFDNETRAKRSQRQMGGRIAVFELKEIN